MVFLAAYKLLGGVANGDLSLRVLKVQVAVILAGGESRRMGREDKAKAVLRGKSLLQHVADRLQPQVDTLAINSNGNTSLQNLPTIPDALTGGLGPLAGIHAAMRWARDQRASHVLTAPVDTPFLPLDLASRLSAASQARSGAIAMAATALPSGPSLQPTIALWPTALCDDLSAALDAGTRKVTDWADRHGILPVTFAADDVDPFFNINTPEDLARAEAM